MGAMKRSPAQLGPTDGRPEGRRDGSYVSSPPSTSLPPSASATRTTQSYNTFRRRKKKKVTGLPPSKQRKQNARQKQVMEKVRIKTIVLHDHKLTWKKKEEKLPKKD